MTSPSSSRRHFLRTLGLGVLTAPFLASGLLKGSPVPGAPVGVPTVSKPPVHISFGPYGGYYQFSDLRAEDFAECPPYWGVQVVEGARFVGLSRPDTTSQPSTPS